MHGDCVGKFVKCGDKDKPRVKGIVSGYFGPLAEISTCGTCDNLVKTNKHGIVCRYSTGTVFDESDVEFPRPLAELDKAYQRSLDRLYVKCSGWKNRKSKDLFKLVGKYDKCGSTKLVPVASCRSCRSLLGADTAHNRIFCGYTCLPKSLRTYDETQVKPFGWDPAACITPEERKSAEEFNKRCKALKAKNRDENARELGAGAHEKIEDELTDVRRERLAKAGLSEEDVHATEWESEEK